MNVVAAFAVGVGLGFVCFGGLWLTLVQVLRRPSRKSWVTMSQIVRLALCTLVLGAISRDGVGAMLPALGGFWVARWHLIRRLGVAADGR